MRVDLLDAIQVFLEPARVVGRFAEYLGQVDIVEGQDFADDIEQSRANLPPLKSTWD